jgi:hypothetical protein
VGSRKTADSAATHVGAGAQSASVNINISPRAWQAPKLRAAAGPDGEIEKQMAPHRLATLAVPSFDPSSTTILTTASESVWSARASKQAGSVRAASRAGTITESLIS